MKFAKLSYFDKENNSPAEHINRRLEYFHHYWNFLFQKNTGFLLLSQERFESHRSLLAKTILQIEENPCNCYDSVKFMFAHPYFNDNIILREDEKCSKTIKSLKSEFCKKNKAWIHDNTQKVTEDIDKIQKLVLKDEYERTLIDLLIRVLNENKRITAIVKKDIQFLVNATIVELFHYGYTRNYILKIPDIILFPIWNKFEFPFHKTCLDFKTSEEYKKYQEEEAKNIHLNQQIACLLNLLKPQKLLGSYVFKIDNIDFQEDNPLTIWGVTFYNPDKIKKIVFSGIGEMKKKVEYDELFLDYFDPKRNNLNLKSTCNAIVEVEYRPLYWNEPDNSLFNALKKVENALHVFNRLKQSYNGNSSPSCRINYSEYILAGSDYIYSRQFHDSFYQKPFKLEPYQTNTFKENLIWINKLNPNIEFQNKLANIYAYHCKSFTDPFAFNFKDYWTVCSEAIYPNKLFKFKDLCKDCLKYMIRRNLFLDAKCFLNSSFTKGWLETFANYFIIEEEKMKMFGLHIPSKGKFSASKFEKEYNQLKQFDNIEFLKDIIEELDSYKNKEVEYFARVDNWIENTVEEVYRERNLEVHNNIQTDFSLISLKDDFLFIVNNVFMSLVWNCDDNTNSIDEVLERIREKGSKKKTLP